MKKALVFVLALVMSLTLSLTAFAAPNGFTVSPGANAAPEIMDFENSSEGCLAELILAAYADRASLDADTRAALEAAYGDIVNASNLGSLTADLAALAQTLGIKIEDLAVSELFDIEHTCDEHDGHGGKFTIKLKSQALQGFVGLLHKNGDKWELVDDATLASDGLYITFSVSDLSPFAIVVKTDSGTESPDSGDSFPYVAVFAFVAAAALGAWLVVGVKRKKA